MLTKQKVHTINYKEDEPASLDEEKTNTFHWRKISIMYINIGVEVDVEYIVTYFLIEENC